jgi:hypothetical protein
MRHPHSVVPPQHSRLKLHPRSSQPPSLHWERFAMKDAEQLKIGESPAYWTHAIGEPNGPVSQFRMSQLIDFDDRLYETARVVYRFMVGWYHNGYGDALLSQRHVAKVMKQRAPTGALVPSRNAVQRAILALMETGWVVRSFQGRGKGKGASRYVPVLNVLELASQGKFPEPAHANGPVEPAHANGPLVAHATGPIAPEPAHVGGPKTRLQDTVTKTRVPVVNDSSAPVAGGPLAAAPDDGFEHLAAAYDKRGDNLAKARRAFNDIAPDAAELERMVAAAASWKRTGTGKRMSLDRWLREKRWLSSGEFANDNRATHRYPSCVITRIKPRVSGDDFEGAQIWFRDRDGSQRHMVLDFSEYRQLQDACVLDRPAACEPSDDLHQFVGARFQLDDADFFEPLAKKAA